MARVVIQQGVQESSHGEDALLTVPIDPDGVQKYG
jgi:hypothetical protein